MLIFKKLELEDIQIIKSYFNVYPSRQCDRSAGAAAMWRNHYNNHYAIYDGTIIFSSNFAAETCFTFPIGRNIDGMLNELSNYCKAKNIPMILCSVNKDELPYIKKKYPGCAVSADRDWFDYLYEKEAMTSLSGRKYNTQRNHINKFKKLYTDWKFEKITKENLPEVIEFMKGFSFHSKKDEAAFDEASLCIEVLENFEAFDSLGGLLRVNGEVIGFSIAEIVGDTFICHIEKADTNYQGAYQMLTNQILVNFADDESVRFVNREEDCGDEGLRKSKLSYHPCELIEKNIVTIDL